MDLSILALPLPPPQSSPSMFLHQPPVGSPTDSNIRRRSSRRLTATTPPDASPRCQSYPRANTCRASHGVQTSIEPDLPGPVTVAADVTPQLSDVLLALEQRRRDRRLGAGWPCSVLDQRRAAIGVMRLPPPCSRATIYLCRLPKRRSSGSNASGIQSLDGLWTLLGASGFMLFT
jgi:hypothetical protein